MLYDNNNKPVFEGRSSTENPQFLVQLNNLNLKLWKMYSQDVYIDEMVETVCYYREVIVSYIIENLKNYSQQEKQAYQEKLIKSSVAPIEYSIRVGFSYYIHWLVTTNRVFTINDLGKPYSSQQQLAYCLVDLFSNDVLKRRLDNDVNYQFLEDVDEHCTAGVRSTILDYLIALWKHGFWEASRCLRTYYKVPTNLVYTPLTHLPMNADAKFSTAFNGRIINANNESETWGIMWNDDYQQAIHQPNGFAYIKDYHQFLFMLNIYKTDVAKITKGKDLGILTALGIYNYLKQINPNIDDEQYQSQGVVAVELVKTDYFADDDAQPRFIQPSEISYYFIDELKNKFSDIFQVPKAYVVVKRFTL